MISKEKRRYSLALTPENVNKFKKLAKQLGMPPAQLSYSVDDFLKSMNETMERCISKGSTSIIDLFAMMGEQILAGMGEETRVEVVKETKKIRSGK